jgi:hypothetical protein
MGTSLLQNDPFSEAELQSFSNRRRSFGGWALWGLTKQIPGIFRCRELEQQWPLQLSRGIRLTAE